MTSDRVLPAIEAGDVAAAIRAATLRVAAELDSTPPGAAKELSTLARTLVALTTRTLQAELEKQAVDPDDIDIIGALRARRGAA